MSNSQKQRLQLQVDKDLAPGRPTNGAVIAHTADEFMFDFVLLMPGQTPVVTSRLVTSPRHAKALLRSLGDNIARFEQKHGPIPEPPARPAADERTFN